MNNLKVVKMDSESIEFEDGTVLHSDHEQDCCENHYLSFRDLSLEDFQGLEFDLSGDNFFNRIEDYGIELLPVSGHSIKVPGYGYNNGYYSSNLSLILSKNGSDGFRKKFNITECQVITD